MNLTIPFDQPDSQACYEIDINPQAIENGDGVVLAVNREACLALSCIFQQLATMQEESFHLHLGYTEQNPQGPGWRIVVNQNGRVGHS